MASIEETIMVAKAPFDHNGTHVRVGTTVRVGHPLLEGGRDQFFAPLVIDHEHVAAPGRHGARAKTAADK